MRATVTTPCGPTTVKVRGQVVQRRLSANVITSEGQLAVVTIRPGFPGRDPYTDLHKLVEGDRVRLTGAREVSPGVLYVKKLTKETDRG